MTEQQLIRDAIQHYARERGLLNVRMEHIHGDLWRLSGGNPPGKVWPLVWFVADELGISRADCGPGYQNVDVGKF